MHRVRPVYRKRKRVAVDKAARNELLISRLADIIWFFVKVVLFLFAAYIFLLAVGLLMRACRIYTNTSIGDWITHNRFLSNSVGAAFVGLIATLILQSYTTVVAATIAFMPSHVITPDQAYHIFLGAQMAKATIDTLITVFHAGHHKNFVKILSSAIIIDIASYIVYIILVPVEQVYNIVEHFTEAIITPLTDKANANTLRWITQPVVSRVIMQAVVIIVPDEYRKLINQCLDPKTLEPFDFCPFKPEKTQVTWDDHVLFGVFFIVFLVLINISQMIVFTLVDKAFTHAFAEKMQNFVMRKLRWFTRFAVDIGLWIFGMLAFPIMMTTPCKSAPADRLFELDKVTLRKFLPMLYGCHIGSTFSGIWAALAAPAADFHHCFLPILSQTFFNILCFFILYKITCLTELVLTITQNLSEKIAKYKWMVFVFTTGNIFIELMIALISTYVPYQGSIPIFLGIIVFFMTISAITIIQRESPNFLPPFLRTWNFLPLWMHSLRPYDVIIQCISDEIKCLQFFTRWKHPEHDKHQNGVHVTTV